MLSILPASLCGIAPISTCHNLLENESQYNSLSVWDINSQSGRNLISMLSSLASATTTGFLGGYWHNSHISTVKLGFGKERNAVPLAVIQGHRLWKPEPPNKLWKFQPPEELWKTKMALAEETGKSRQESREEPQIT